MAVCSGPGDIIPLFCPRRHSNRTCARFEHSQTVRLGGLHCQNGYEIQMSSQTVSISQSLGIPSILATCRNLHSQPAAEMYELDFSRTQHFEPLGMLMIGSAIRRLAERDLGNGQTPTVVISGKSLSKQGHDYARRLGFWWSIGDDSDLPTVMQTATGTTIPISRLLYADLFRQAGGRDPIRAEVVGKAAADLATTLNGGPEKSPLWLALEYCFREMFRNAFEHGRTDSVWYAGATRPNKDDVQIAIVDSGRGIKESLSDNPQERYATDVDAISSALRPGVSRNANRTRSHEMTEKVLEEFPGQNPALYDNSGYGLTLTSYLGRDAGQFTIISGSGSINYVGHSETISETRHVGTAVRVVLHPSKLEGAIERALQKAHADGTPRSGSLISASMMKRLGLEPSKPRASPST
jgi:hypothetical protein